MNNEDFVTYEQALNLKKLGFNEKCYQYYDTSGIIQDNDIICNEVFQSIISSQLLSSHNSGVPKDTCDAPTLEQARGWLREKMMVDIEIPMEPHPDHVRTYNIYAICCTETNPFAIEGEGYNSYNEALSICITECLNHLCQDLK